jgi:hypothetical protein
LRSRPQRRQIRGLLASRNSSLLTIAAVSHCGQIRDLSLGGRHFPQKGLQYQHFFDTQTTRFLETFYIGKICTGSIYTVLFSSRLSGAMGENTLLYGIRGCFADLH